MVRNAQLVIDAMIRALDRPAHHPAPPRRPVITVSRLTASRGDEIARLLAARLEVGYYDHEILDAVAARSGVSQQTMETLTDKVNALESWLYSTVFGAHVSRGEYHDHLVAVIRGLYHTGGVILGRGAHLILAGRDVLRVRIIGSIDTCASRLAEAEGLSFVEAKREVEARKAASERFLWETFGARPSDELTYDLIINTDCFRDDAAVVELVANAYHARTQATGLSDAGARS